MRIARSAFGLDTPEKTTRHHVFSELNGPWEDFTSEERHTIVRDVYACADFAGIEVRAVGVGPRWFDLLLDVPDQLTMDREEMFARLLAYQKKNITLSQPAPFDQTDEKQWGRLAKRFGDLGAFMKQVKMLCAARYHDVHGVRGTIWTSRYVDTYVQTGFHSRILCAWMDHAGIRNSESTDPVDNPYSTFGLACAGDKRARGMIRYLFAESGPWARAKREYQHFIADTTTPAGKPKRTISGLPPLLDREEFLRADVPHFRGGMAFGDEEFCRNFVEQNRAQFPAERLFGGRPIAGQNDPRLCTVRQKGDLRKHLT